MEFALYALKFGAQTNAKSNYLSGPAHKLHDQNTTTNKLIKITPNANGNVNAECSYPNILFIPQVAFKLKLFDNFLLHFLVTLQV